MALGDRTVGGFLKLGELGGLVVIADGVIKGNPVEIGAGLTTSVGSIALEKARRFVKRRLRKA